MTLSQTTVTWRDIASNCKLTWEMSTRANIRLIRDTIYKLANLCLIKGALGQIMVSASSCCTDGLGRSLDTQTEISSNFWWWKRAFNNRSKRNWEREWTWASHVLPRPGTIWRMEWEKQTEDDTDKPKFPIKMSFPETRCSIMSSYPQHHPTPPH
jgi:hypothetical protein